MKFKKLILLLLLSQVLMFNYSFAGDRTPPHKPPHKPTPMPPHNPPHTPPDHQDAIEARNIYVDDFSVKGVFYQQFRPRVRYSINNLLRLGREFWGREITHVTFKGYSNSNWARITLYANASYYRDSISGDNSRRGFVTFKPQVGRNIFGRDIRTLDFDLSDYSYIDEITVWFRPQETDYYGPSDLEKRVNYSIIGETDTYIPVRQVLSVDNFYNGRRLDWVVVSASLFNGRARAQLLINRRPVSQPTEIVWVGENRYYFELPEYYTEDVIGQDVHSIEIVVSGDRNSRLQVNRVGLKFKRGHYRKPNH